MTVKTVVAPPYVLPPLDPETTSVVIPGASVTLTGHITTATGNISSIEITQPQPEAIKLKKIKPQPAPCYVAATLSHWHVAKSVSDVLEGTGLYKTVFKWWDLPGSPGVHGEVPRSKEYWSQRAHDELNGVRSADYLFLIHPGRLGAQSEFGAALALGINTILFAKSEASLFEYEGAHGNVFWLHPTVNHYYGPDHLNCLRQYLRFEHELL